MSSRALQPPPKSIGSRAGGELVFGRVLDALVTVVFVAVGAIVLMVGGMLVASLHGYKSAWESICQRDYAVAAIWTTYATISTAIGLSLMGFAIWLLAGPRIA